MKRLLLCLTMLLPGCKKNDNSNTCGCASPFVRDIAQMGQIINDPIQSWTIVNIPSMDAPVFFICNTEFSALAPLIKEMKDKGLQKSDTIQFSGHLKKACSTAPITYFATPYHVELTNISKLK